MEKVCHNCGTAISSPFCPQCGQDAHVGRLNMHSLLHEIWHGFTHTDKGILKLVKDIALKPAKVYNAYFDGARKTYFSPMVFFLLSFGIYVYLDQKVFDYEDYIVHMFNEYGRRYHLQLKYIALTLLPVQALFTWALFFRKRNLAECIVFWLYCIGTVNMLWILMTPLRFWLIEDKHVVDFCLAMLTLLIIAIHAWKVFGTSWRNKIWVLLLVFLLQIINVYVSSYYIIHNGIPAHYPSLPEAVQEIFWLLKSK
jgi:hypothetical protein